MHTSTVTAKGDSVALILSLASDSVPQIRIDAVASSLTETPQIGVTGQ